MRRWFGVGVLATATIVGGSGVAQVLTDTRGAEAAAGQSVAYTEVTFTVPVLRWEIDPDGGLILKRSDTDSSSPITTPPKCTALRKPCPRKSPTKTVEIVAFDQWKVRETLGDATLGFEVMGPRKSFVLVDGDDVNIKLKPELSRLPWRPGEWDFDVVVSTSGGANLRVESDRIVDSATDLVADPTIQEVSPITDPGDACWVEVPCPSTN